MTRIKNDMLNKEIGARVKILAKENGDKAEVLANCLFCTKEQISRYYNGHCTISRDRITILAKRWNIREEYLLCEDDFKTNDELYAVLKENNIKNMQHAIDYLESLGLYLKPYTKLHCSLTSFKKHIDELKPYIKKDAFEKLMKQYDFNLPNDEFYKKYFSERCSVELFKPLPHLPFLDKENISKGEHIPHATFIQAGDENNILQQNYNVNLGFAVYYQNKFIRTICVDNLQEFIEQLDNYTKCTIETLLIGKQYRFRLFQ